MMVTTSRIEKNANRTVLANAIQLLVPYGRVFVMNLEDLNDDILEWTTVYVK